MASLVSMLHLVWMKSNAAISASSVGMWSLAELQLPCIVSRVALQCAAFALYHMLHTKCCTCTSCSCQCPSGYQFATCDLHSILAWTNFWLRDPFSACFWSVKCICCFKCICCLQREACYIQDITSVKCSYTLAWVALCIVCWTKLLVGQSSGPMTTVWQCTDFWTVSAAWKEMQATYKTAHALDYCCMSNFV